MPQVAIVMPKMSMTMTEGELLVWHVKVGDVITAGDVVCEVATDKVDMEVEATASGTVVSLIGNPGDVIEVGLPLIMVESEEDDLLAGIFDAPTPVQESETEIATEGHIETPLSADYVTPTKGGLATPKARATAREHGVDLQVVTPTRPSGVITHEDVLARNESSLVQRDLASRLKTRLAISRALTSSTTIPAFSLTFETSSVALASDEINRLVVVVSAWAQALQEHPELHVNWKESESHTFSEVIVAISVMSDKGVVTPAVNISNLTNVQDLKVILENAKQSKIALEHLRTSTTGFADLSRHNVSAMNSLLVAPQSTALTLCALEPNFRFSITADHRVSDPADVALLAETFIRKLR